MNFKELLKRTQEKPESVRKKILWTIVAVITIILFSLWLYMVKARLQLFGDKMFLGNIGASNLKEELKTPQTELPLMNLEFSEEDFKKLEEILTKDEMQELKKFLKKDNIEETNIIEENGEK